MTCAVHSDTEATGFCRNCGKGLCAQCTREVNGTFYCQDCLGALIAGPKAAGISSRTETQSGPHPGVALALGFIPGLGAVYNGEYIKALVHVAIFGGIIAALNTQMPDAYEAFLGIGLGCFYLYMPVDAYRTARSRMAHEPSANSNPLEASDAGPASKPLGAIIMVIIGVLFLLGNLGWLDREWIAKGWPVILIAVGVWMLVDRFGPNT